MLIYSYQHKNMWIYLCISISIQLAYWYIIISAHSHIIRLVDHHIMLLLYHISTLWQTTNYCNGEDLTKIITWRNIPAMPSSQKCACGSREDRHSWGLSWESQLHLLPEQTGTSDRNKNLAKLITCQQNKSGTCFWPKKKHLQQPGRPHLNRFLSGSHRQ